MAAEPEDGEAGPAAEAPAPAAETKEEEPPPAAAETKEEAPAAETKDALAAYVNASSTELNHVPSKVAIGALLSKQGPKYLPAARSFLSDALRIEPTNRMAWLNLGKVHKLDGRISDAADCFQAAVMLEESDPDCFQAAVMLEETDPVESFRGLS